MGDKRTLGDEIQDNATGLAGGSHGGRPSLSHELGRQERERMQKAQTPTPGVNASPPRYDGAPPTEMGSYSYSGGAGTSSGISSTDKLLISFLALAVGVFIALAGIGLGYNWFLPVAVGLVSAIGFGKLLAGPLHFLVTIIKWLVGLAVAGGILAYFLGR